VGEVDVEGENLASEGILRCKMFGAADAPLPGAFSHRAIMGLWACLEQILGNSSPQRHRESQEH
jgi:hypothetical protein